MRKKIRKELNRHWNCLPWLACGLSVLMRGEIGRVTYGLTWITVLMLLWIRCPMGRNFNGDAVKEGDKVIVYISCWGNTSLSVREVVKKTPTGLIDVKTSGGGVTRYRKDGSLYANAERYSNYTNYLMSYSEELERQIQQDKDRKAMLAHLSKVTWSKYTNEELDNILRYISRIKI